MLQPSTLKLRAFAKKRVGDERARIARTKRIKAALSGSTLDGVLNAVRHKQTYVSDDCVSDGLTNALNAACMVQCDDIANAAVFVAKNPGRGQAGAMLVSALRGCYQISPGLLLSHGNGHAVKYQPRMLQPRILFASQQFKNTHDDFCKLVEMTLAAGPAAGCKTKIEFSPDVDDSSPDSRWQALVGRYKTKPSQLLALVLQSEVHSVAFNNWKHVYTAKNIVKQLSLLDPSRCFPDSGAASWSLVG